MESNNDLRPALLSFAHLMESQLQRNDYKGGWRVESLQFLFARLTEESYELQASIANKDSADTIRREAADVANFAMMIADVCKPTH